MIEKNNLLLKVCNIAIKAGEEEKERAKHPDRDNRVEYGCVVKRAVQVPGFLHVHLFIDGS